MSQIRITKNKELEEVMEFLKNEFTLLSEAEIIKMALSKVYKEYKDQKNSNKKKLFAMVQEGKTQPMTQQGRDWLIRKGFDPDSMTEEEILDALYRDEENEK